MKVSVIVPVYNEEGLILKCLESLEKQTYREMEIIVVDDGSTDKTLKIVSVCKPKISHFKILHQGHKGPGMARNLGASQSDGEILVFVDADMTFDKSFIEKLIQPILRGRTIGTFSKEEYVENADTIWSKCWNLNKGLPTRRMHPKDYPDEQKVFRAILKKSFIQSGGFKPIGYVDDYTVSEALGVLAINAPGAVFYHHNPDSLAGVFTQARWIGKSEYKRRKVKNEPLMRLISLARYFLLISLIKGIVVAWRNRLPQFIIFKVIYDLSIEISLIGSFLGEQRYK